MWRSKAARRCRHAQKSLDGIFSLQPPPSVASVACDAFTMRSRFTDDGSVVPRRCRDRVRCRSNGVVQSSSFARSKLRTFIFRIGGVDGAGGASTLMATIDLEVPVRSVAVGLSGGDVIDVDVRRGAGAAESP